MEEMEEDFDIYADLLNPEDGNENNAQHLKANAEPNDKCHESQEKVKDSNESIQTYVAEINTLKKNLSSLILTARNELKRKDRTIADLRKQLDNMAFRRGPRFQPRVDQVAQVPEIPQIRKFTTKAVPLYSNRTEFVGKTEDTNVDDADDDYINNLKLTMDEEDTESKYESKTVPDTVYAQRLREKLLKEDIARAAEKKKMEEKIKTEESIKNQEELALHKMEKPIKEPEKKQRKVDDSRKKEERERQHRIEEKKRREEEKLQRLTKEKRTKDNEDWREIKEKRRKNEEKWRKDEKELNRKTEEKERKDKEENVSFRIDEQIFCDEVNIRLPTIVEELQSKDYAARLRPLSFPPAKKSSSRKRHREEDENIPLVKRIRTNENSHNDRYSRNSNGNRNEFPSDPRIRPWSRDRHHEKFSKSRSKSDERWVKEQRISRYEKSWDALRGRNKEGSNERLKNRSDHYQRHKKSRSKSGDRLEGSKHSDRRQRDHHKKSNQIRILIPGDEEKKLLKDEGKKVLGDVKNASAKSVENDERQILKKVEVLNNDMKIPIVRVRKLRGRPKTEEPITPNNAAQTKENKSTIPKGKAAAVAAKRSPIVIIRRKRPVRLSNSTVSMNVGANSMFPKK